MYTPISNFFFILHMYTHNDSEIELFEEYTLFVVLSYSSSHR